MDTGCTVTTPDGALRVEIPPDALPGDTTISVTQIGSTSQQVDLMIGSSPGRGLALAVFDLEPDGLVFQSPVQINVVLDVTSLNQNQRQKLDLWILTDTTGDGTPDSFVALGATCDAPEDPPGAFVVTCSVWVDHFSTYALAFVLDAIAIPAVSQGGLLLFAVLLTGACLLMLRRRLRARWG